MTIYTEVGADEAKTHFSDFLRKVKAGAVIRITQHGEHVADLVPPETIGTRDATRAAKHMGNFMRNREAIIGVNTKALIKEERD